MTKARKLFPVNPTGFHFICSKTHNTPLLAHPNSHYNAKHYRKKAETLGRENKVNPP
jgi:hypothetical protein